MSRPRKESSRNLYDRIADVHNVTLKLNGYRRSVAKFMRSLDLGIHSESIVLDAGSGTGIVTMGFQSSGLRPKNVFALDLSMSSLQLAREQFQKDEECDNGNIVLVQGNILELPFMDNTFDLVITCGVLEYVPLDQGLKELARVLKPGAKLVLIPVKPSIIGTILEFLYKFKTYSIEQVREAALKHFKVVGDYRFPLTEPIAWSKVVFLLEKS